MEYTRKSYHAGFIASLIRFTCSAQVPYRLSRTFAEDYLRSKFYRKAKGTNNKVCYGNDNLTLSFAQLLETIKDERNRL